jgi:transcriptional regulator with XRE-family HTH domain
MTLASTARVQEVDAPILRLDLLAVHVTKRRLDAGLTQRDVARELRLTPSTICRVENELMCDLETFSRLCAWLGNSPTVYLGLSSALPLPPARCGKCARIRKLLEEP